MELRYECLVKTQRLPDDESSHRDELRSGRTGIPGTLKKSLPKRGTLFDRGPVLYRGYEAADIWLRFDSQQECRGCPIMRYGIRR